MLCAPRAQAAPGNTQFTVSCGSSTTPASLIPSTVIKSSFAINPDPSGANAVYIFSYVGTLPTSPPANCTSAGTGAGCIKLAAGQPYADAQNWFSSGEANFQSAFNDGWACVIASGGSAVVVSGNYR